jgi:folate-binding Fe-S cluster repair protein YgfZ
MRTALEGLSLENTGVVRVHGTDAVKFLQGQLSNDVATLNAQQSVLAGYHNPQGRTIAVLRLVQWNADDVLALLPREICIAGEGKGRRRVGCLAGGRAHRCRAGRRCRLRD